MFLFGLESMSCDDKKGTSRHFLRLVLFGTPKYRNIEPLGGLQKGGKIHR